MNVHPAPIASSGSDLGITGDLSTPNNAQHLLPHCGPTHTQTPPHPLTELQAENAAKRQDLGEGHVRFGWLCFFWDVLKTWRRQRRQEEQHTHRAFQLHQVPRGPRRRPQETHTSSLVPCPMSWMLGAQDLGLCGSGGKGETQPWILLAQASDITKARLRT